MTGLSPMVQQMIAIAAAFVMGEFILAMTSARGVPISRVLADRAPRFLMAALVGLAIGYVLHIFGIKVA